jgi:excisionase family DNA binding protein
MPKLLTSAEARSRIGVSRAKLEALIHQGEIEAFKTGSAPNSHYRISEESLAAYIERHKVPAAAAS